MFKEDSNSREYKELNEIRKSIQNMKVEFNKEKILRT